MTNDLTIKSIDVLRCDAGWRNYEFLKITTQCGIVGWSEFDEGFGAPGVGVAIERLKPRVLGKSAGDHERIYAELSTAIQPATGGVGSLAIGAIENALLDAKAKYLEVPCYSLLGGKIRDRVRVYWSHVATWRINHSSWYQPNIHTLDDVKAAGAEAVAKGFNAFKADMFTYTDGVPRGWRPGFNDPFLPELTIDKKVLRGLRTHLEALRDGAGPDADILLDLNFNARTDGYVKILREIADLDIYWVEIDLYNPKGMAHIRNHSQHTIASLETQIGMKGFRSYFDEQAADVAIVDIPWNGAWQSMKIANLAASYDVNVAPHNYYGHLCTLMNAHFAAAVPNLQIMETDIDKISWEDELFSHAPEYVDGHLLIPDRPGWGCDPVEEAILARPPKGQGGLLSYGTSA
jgi:galactonate dehydratase